jgi:hypothetical protein
VSVPATNLRKQDFAMRPESSGPLKEMSTALRFKKQPYLLDLEANAPAEPIFSWHFGPGPRM